MATGNGNSFAQRAIDQIKTSDFEAGVTRSPMQGRSPKHADVAANAKV
jgi:hypothetical protein